MHIITKKVTLLPVPFIGTMLKVRIDSTLQFKIRLATIAVGREHIKVDWGDGTADVFGGTIGNAVHTYPAPGDYAIRISDDIKQIAIGFITDESEYCAIYAPMVTGLFSNATRLSEIPNHAFHNSYNLAKLDVSNSAVEAIGGVAFKNCTALKGDFYFVGVKEIRGGSNALPFAGCANITALHFAGRFEEAIKAGEAYNGDAYHTLGTGIPDICRFDL